MTYKLGAIGFGHWFERLYAGMINSNQITLAKVIGVSPIEGKLERLKKAGLDPDNYYIMEPDGPIPEEFFDDLDIVHVSNPNKFHATQTLESFQHNKITITEKTWGSTKQEFYTVLDYVKQNKLENKSYLHLHYVHKLLTLELPSLLKKLTPEHGKISAISLTFFEEARDEDERRAQWLFSMENGGLFMDWIHPFEIIYTGCLADSAKLRYVDLYTTKKEYGEDFPTGIRAKLSMEGGYFSNGAIGTIRIAKGLEVNKKATRVIFEDGAFLELHYMDTDKERPENRGTWILNNKGKIEQGIVSGRGSSDYFVDDILKLCSGEQSGLTIEMIEKIFAPQWAYQEMSQGKKIDADPVALKRFVDEGVNLV